MQNENIHTINWSKYFDRIYCIHYLPFSNRVRRITDELVRVGIFDSGIFSWKFTFDSPFYGNLLKSGIRMKHETLNNLSMLKCTLAHYSVYKEAQGLGFGRILILEDDIVFLKDIDRIHSIMENFPFDYDVVMFDKWPFSRNVYLNCLQNRVNEDFCKFKDSFSSGAAYSLSAKAVDFVINRQETLLHAGDTAWLSEGIDGIKRCFSVENMCIQSPYTDSYTENMNHGVMKYFYSMCDVNEANYGK